MNIKCITCLVLTCNALVHSCCDTVTSLIVGENIMVHMDKILCSGNFLRKFHDNITSVWEKNFLCALGMHHV